MDLRRAPFPPGTFDRGKRAREFRNEPLLLIGRKHDHRVVSIRITERREYLPVDAKVWVTQVSGLDTVWLAERDLAKFGCGHASD